MQVELETEHGEGMDPDLSILPTASPVVLPTTNENFERRYEETCSSGDKRTEVKYGPVIRLLVYFAFMFQAVFRISDNALNVLLKFLALFFRTLSQKVVNLPQLFLDSLPVNMYTARKVLVKKQSFTKYVCCPKCGSLYSITDCSEKIHCDFVKFPNHSQPQHRKPCGTMLVKEVKNRNGKIIFYPKFIYCYKSVVDSLQEMLRRPGFYAKCEQWRIRSAQNDVLSDVYDGTVWTKFLNPNGNPFLSLPGNYAFQLNVDWFNPFKYTTHSEGAIYLSILNLPRNERYLQENIFLVGVIPGPREPHLNINSYLRPLVAELRNLWSGVVLENAQGMPIIVRAALICCTCDIPALRKVCGFVGHAAEKGCSKCLLSFPTSFGDRPDYSNFDISQWTPRNTHQHRSAANDHIQCSTRMAQKKIEKENGVRYSILLELPYFDPVQMSVIDPMHNLLLGTAKHITEIWKSKSILKSDDFHRLQAKCDNFVCPADIGRIPSKISSGMSGLTADQWKNWVIFFSSYALKDVLPWRDYNCWKLFVKICFLLCRRTITMNNLDEADELIKQFWKLFVELYGADKCTINIHLHGHLTSCVREYGPVYSFWCFAFERMNGILGSYITNNRCVSIQYMERFLSSKTFASVNWPSEFRDDYLPLLQQFVYNEGSIMQATLETEIVTQVCKLLPPIREVALTETQKSDMQPFIDREVGASYRPLTLCKQSKTITVQNFVIGGRGSRHSKSSLILIDHNTEPQLAEIECFFDCVVKSTTGPQLATITFVHGYWLLEHPCKLWFGNPVQVWTTVTSPSPFLIPVRCIKSRVVYIKCKETFGRLENDQVYVIVPLLSSLPIPSC